MDRGDPRHAGIGGPPLVGYEHQNRRAFRRSRATTPISREEIMVDRKFYVLPAVILQLLICIGPSKAWAKTIAAGPNFALAIASGGSLYAWGANGSGQLGNGTLTSSNSPVQIATGTTWSAVAAGSNFSVAIKSDGTLWAWGNNATGQLGIDPTTTSSSPTPVQIGNVTIWSDIAAGTDFAVARRSDGTLWAWGNNANGQLGIGSTSGYTSGIYYYYTPDGSGASRRGAPSPRGLISPLHAGPTAPSGRGA